MIIIVRHNIDYTNEPTDGAFTPPMVIKFREAIKEHWGKHFRIPFPQYRNSVRDIAAQCLKQSDHQILNLVRELRLPPNTRFVPVDDDDWINPNISLPEKGPKILLWRFNVLSDTLTSEYTNKAKTNNYAIRTRNKQELAFHWKVKIKPRNHRKLLTKDASVAVKHPGSIGTFLAFIKRTAPSQNRFKEKLVREEPLPTHLSWCVPYYHQLLDLYKQLI